MPEQVAEWKKKKLLVRTAILSHSIGADHGPKISPEVLFPLSLDTLELLVEKLEAEVRSLQSMVGQSSTKLIDMQTLHRRVKQRIVQKTGGLRLVA